MASSFGRNPAYMRKIINEKNRLIKKSIPLRPKNTRRFVKDKKTGKWTTKEFPNKASNIKFVKVHNDIYKLERKLYGKSYGGQANFRLKVNKKTGEISEVKRQQRRKTKK